MKYTKDSRFQHIESKQAESIQFPALTLEYPCIPSEHYNRHWPPYIPPAATVEGQKYPAKDPR